MSLWQDANAIPIIHGLYQGHSMLCTLNRGHSMLCTLNCCLSVAIYAVASSRLLPFINGHLSCAIEKTIPFINGQPCCNLLLYCSCAYSVVISCVLVNTALINGHQYYLCQRSSILPLSMVIYTALVNGHLYCPCQWSSMLLVKGHI